MSPEGVSAILGIGVAVCAVVGFFTITDGIARAGLDLWKWWKQRRGR